MMHKELAMQQRWCGFLIAGWLAGCGSSPPATSQTVPDDFDDNMDVLMRSTAHPCGADWDFDGDGAVDVHYSYTYDPLGRSARDVGTDPGGGLYEQIDYAWDNAGHLVDRHDVVQGSGALDQAAVYDTLGRQTQVKELQSISTATGDTPAILSTLDYSDFDELGHSRHYDDLYQNFQHATSYTLTGEADYDELGRRISAVDKLATGETIRTWIATYDDVAHTVTATTDQPQLLNGNPGQSVVETRTYDTEAHLLTIHSVITDAADTGHSVSDAVYVWDGNRELTSTGLTTATDADGQVSIYKSVSTFLYSCPSARIATDHLPGTRRPPHGALRRGAR
jgi:hypothetical protein